MKAGRGPVSILAVLVLAVACGGPVQRPGHYPEGCGDYLLSPKRCSAVVTKGLEAANIARAEVVSIDLLQVPRPNGPSLGGYMAALLGIHLADGSVVQQEVWCIGISGAFDPACGDEARIDVGMGIDHDTMCDDNGVCAKLPPEPPAALVTQATPLRVAARDIAVDHSGHYEVKLGTATLPDGYLSERTLTLVDDQPTSFWLEQAWLEVRPDFASRPPVGNVYREPYDGLEPVTVYFVFDVTRFAEPGVVQIRNVVVH